MKQKDIILIIVAVFISGMLSFFVSNKLFTVQPNQQAEVEVIEPITAEFPTPDARYFNDKSFDPTQSIKIGEGQNSQPFTSGN